MILLVRHFPSSQSFARRPRSFSSFSCRPGASHFPDPSSFMMCPSSRLVAWAFFRCVVQKAPPEQYLFVLPPRLTPLLSSSFFSLSGLILFPRSLRSLPIGYQFSQQLLVNVLFTPPPSTCPHVLPVWLLFFKRFAPSLLMKNICPSFKLSPFPFRLLLSGLFYASYLFLIYVLFPTFVVFVCFFFFFWWFFFFFFVVILHLKDRSLRLSFCFCSDPFRRKDHSSFLKFIFFVLFSRSPSSHRPVPCPQPRFSMRSPSTALP